MRFKTKVVFVEAEPYQKEKHSELPITDKHLAEPGDWFVTENMGDKEALYLISDEDFQRYYEPADMATERQLAGAGPRMKTLLIDFDGTLHPYHKSWGEYNHDAPASWDAPTEETKRVLEKYCQHFRVQIFSTRSRTPEGVAGMKQWFALYFSPEVQEKLTYSAEKGAHYLIIDDRAFGFQGSWPSVEEVLAFKPWNKR